MEKENSIQSDIDETIIEGSTPDCENKECSDSELRESSEIEEEKLCSEEFIDDSEIQPKRITFYDYHERIPGMKRFEKWKIAETDSSLSDIEIFKCSNGYRILYEASPVGSVESIDRVQCFGDGFIAAALNKKEDFPPESPPEPTTCFFSNLGLVRDIRIPSIFTSIEDDQRESRPSDMKLAHDELYVRSGRSVSTKALSHSGQEVRSILRRSGVLENEDMPSPVRRANSGFGDEASSKSCQHETLPYDKEFVSHA